MSSIQRWVGPNLPRWMARVSGVALIAVGLLEPIWSAQPVAPVITQIASNLPAVATVPGLPAQPAAGPAPVGLAVTPPMGWNGFNRFHRDVNEGIVESEARALVASGMAAAGYRYVNLDGGWDLLKRTWSGQLVPDPRKFPHGIKPVADYVHSLGLKFGIYTSAGYLNCAQTSAGSYGYYKQDAAMFASWGVDYVKLDWCSIPYRFYPGLSRRQVSQLLAGQMAQALASTRRPMVYDVNDWADTNPGSWARGLAHMWRTASDSRDAYSSLLFNFTHTVGLYQSAGPGGWNDPDMLEVGNGGMNATEYRSEFSLWAEMAAPLIAGNDLTAMSRNTVGILTNPQVIAVDQDRLGQPGRPIAKSNGLWVLAKPLEGGDVAVVLFNATNVPAIISTTAREVGVASGARYDLDDLWGGAMDRETTGSISANVPAHGVVMYTVSTLRSNS